MDSTTVTLLLDLNRRFYEQFGAEFAATRQRIQNGVRRVFRALPDEGYWLDLGCGSGALAVEWLKATRCSRYLGLDFSAALLSEARQALALLPESCELPECSPISFRQADLADPLWTNGLITQPTSKLNTISIQPPGFYRGVLAFAVLHHLPSLALRLRILRQIHHLLDEQGLFAFSVWQFQNSQKLMERRLPWSEVGLSDDQLEPNDTLLDWRFALPGKTQARGLRYVHLFGRDELADLAAQTGFRVLESFESDGQGGRLGLYQRWQRA